MNLNNSITSGIGFHGFVIPPEHHGLQLTMDSPIENFLPAFTGPGICLLMLAAYLIETNNNILEKYSGTKEIEQTTIPKLQAEQLAAPGSPTAYLEFGPSGTNALLYRCILRNCTYSLRVPTCNGAHVMSQGDNGQTDNSNRPEKQSLKPKLIYDTAQIFADIEDEFLKNKALISYQVSINTHRTISLY